MKKIMKKFRINRTYRQFLFSFLVILCLPIICFSSLFLRNYCDFFSEKIIDQAEKSLEGAGMEIERDINGLQMIATYNSLKHSALQGDISKDYAGKAIKGVLNAELSTHSVLEKIAYYSKRNPDMIYTNEGTYSVAYYARLCAGMQKEEFLEYLESLNGSEWTCWTENQKEETCECLYYIIKYDKDKWWFFRISNSCLEQVMEAENSVSVLQDCNGRQLYTTGMLPNEEYYEVTFRSKQGKFQLIRYLDEEFLFAEVDIWQRSFLLITILILLAGGLLTLFFTLYHGHPIKELEDYCMDSVQDIPDDMEGLDIFRYALKSMEEQAVLLERKQRINQLLLHLLHGRDCDTENFKNVMKEEFLFQNAECYRVILALPISGSEIVWNKIHLYIKEKVEKKEYEFRFIDILSKEVVIVIVGMTMASEEKLKTKLLQIVDEIEENIDEEFCFYVGGRCCELKDIHLSYSQAVSCKRNCHNMRGQKVIFYKSEKGKDNKFQYPKDEIGKLYEALVQINLKQAYAITDKLVGILSKCSGNQFVGMSLYYDILNSYYRAFSKLEIDMGSEFLETEILEVRETSDAIEMIYNIKKQYYIYVKKNKSIGKSKNEKESLSKKDFCSKVFSYIDENKKSCDLSVSMVADYFGMSISHISHKFKEQTNRTISDYITEVKFAYVCELLSESEYSIKEIAFMTGYSHPVSFIRKFKQLYGMTPMEYRMKLRE